MEEGLSLHKVVIHPVHFDFLILIHYYLEILEICRGANHKKLAHYFLQAHMDSTAHATWARHQIRLTPHLPSILKTKVFFWFEAVLLWVAFCYFHIQVLDFFS